MQYGKGYSNKARYEVTYARTNKTTLKLFRDDGYNILGGAYESNSGGDTTKNSPMCGR